MAINHHIIPAALLALAAAVPAGATPHSDPVVPPAERPMWHSMRHSMRLPGGGDGQLIERFIFDYPASPVREEALLLLADAAYDRGDYPAAYRAYMAVDPAALDAAKAEDRDYRLAYCLLKTGEYDRARAIYERLALTRRLANDAGFYLGYIAYATGDYRGAITRLAATRRVPGTPAADAGYYLAQSLLMAGEYAQAAREARSLLAAGCPGEYRAETLRVLGEALYATGDRREAVKHLEEYAALATQPATSALYILGVNDFHNGDYSRATQRLAPATSLDSEMGQSALVYSGEAYMRRGEYSAASLVLERACRMDFDPALRETACYDYAMAKAGGGRVPFGSTVALFEDFLNRYPSSSRAPLVRQYVVNGYMTDNNYAAALAAINRAKDPTPEILRAKQVVLYNLGARELQQGNPAAALPRFTEAASMTRQNPAVAAEARLWEGQALYRLGRYQEAAKAFNTYLKSDSRGDTNRALAYYDLGYARFAMKQFDKARADFERYLAIATGAKAATRADALNRVADCLYYATDFAAADRAYLQAYDLDPAAGDYPLYQQGLMKGLTRDHRGKIATLTRVTREFPSSALVPSALLEIGQSYTELDDTADAIDTYRRLADTYPSTTQGRQGMLLLAISYLNSGRRDDAIQAYRRVIANHPTSDEARAAAEDLKLIYADNGRVAEYAAFLSSIPDAPKLERGEIASLTLVSAEKALEEGRLADARDRADEVATQYPDAPEAVRALAIKAEVELTRGDTESALRTYRLYESKASDAADINAARMGILRVAHTLGLAQDAIDVADRVLASSSVGSAEKREATFDKAMALAALGHADQAHELWDTLASDTDDLFGAKAAYYRAQAHFDAGDADTARREVNTLIDADTPHDYWLARGFILLSDILRADGDKYQADAYLNSLRGNYPGTEADIFEMIDTRLGTSR